MCHSGWPRPASTSPEIRGLQRGRPNPGPAELRVLKRFGKQTHPRAIKPDRLDPVRSFRAEYVERATEWISATIPNQGHQAGGSLAGSQPACSPHKPAPPPGSCLANRPDHIGKPIRFDVPAGAHHHIANNNFYRVAPHRFKAREPDRPTRRSAQRRNHPRGYRLATPRKQL